MRHPMSFPSPARLCRALWILSTTAISTFQLKNLSISALTAFLAVNFFTREKTTDAQKPSVVERSYYVLGIAFSHLFYFYRLHYNKFLHENQSLKHNFAHKNKNLHTKNASLHTVFVSLHTIRASLHTKIKTCTRKTQACTFVFKNCLRAKKLPESF